MNTSSRKFNAISGHVVLVIFALIAILPLALVAINSVKNSADVTEDPLSLPTGFNFQNFIDAWSYGNFGLGFMNSLVLTATTVVVVLVLSSLAGYVLAGKKVRSWPVIMVYFTMAMTVPIQLFLFPLYSGFAQLGLLDNVPAVGVVLAAINMPFGVFMMRTFFLNVPAELEEAAFVDGVNTFQLIRHILFPVVRPGLITVGVIVGLNAWNEFLITSTFLQNSSTKTLTLGFLSMNGTFSTDLGVMMAGAMILIVPVLAIFIALQRYVVDGLASGSVKG
ncbi:carbohydrate ABC transporter permease [Arthrobacter sp. Soil762]|uniref:carbohydrate ABC transporter permease n=1 Tax=Arthrobacter sp. Soil762 TaxID=1736401 RepID=UPI0006F874D1|nr:carbohydrate ABC transporter permease [Arthrobacter sp. Soil762]KRE72713.1 sugar ABC transporter permease [Arthrobacter sp. Soil762]